MNFIRFLVVLRYFSRKKCVIALNIYGKKIKIKLNGQFFSCRT